MVWSRLQTSDGFDAGLPGVEPRGGVFWRDAVVGDR